MLMERRLIKMDVYNLLKGGLFIIIAIFIFDYEFKDRGIKQDDDNGFKYNAIGGAIILIILALYYITEEFQKII